MPVTKTTDSLLFLQVSEYDRVILKYHTDECGELCKKFIPIYSEFSNLPKYKDIHFLTIDGEENPVAKNYILSKKQPVITIYLKGKLLNSRHESTKEGLEEMLQDLLNQK